MQNPSLYKSLSKNIFLVVILTIFDAVGNLSEQSSPATATAQSGPQILLQEDFEDSNLGNRGWYDIARWGTEQFITTAEQITGNASLEVRYPAGSTGPWMRHQFPPQDRIYTRYYRKWAPNWVWPTSSGPHDTYLFAMYGQQFFPPTDTYLTVYTDSIYQGSPNWQFGTVGLLTRRILQGESYRAFTSLNPPPSPFQLNRWYCIETLATLNTPGSSNGQLQLWLDGTLIYDVTGLILRDSNNSTLQFDQFMFGPYFHGGTPQVQSTWIDALVIATDRVGCLAGTPSTDTIAPSTPTNLSATAISSSQINLSWTASTDNVGVTGYSIYRNDVRIAVTSTPSYSDTGLNPSTTYTYAVAAFDALGNTSAQSTSASATTQASTGGGGGGSGSGGGCGSIKSMNPRSPDAGQVAIEFVLLFFPVVVILLRKARRLRLC